MNEELLNLLREIADPAKCNLPDGWKGEINQRNQPVFGDYATTWAISGLHVNNVMDLLGRLSRAIESDGMYQFWRGEKNWPLRYWSLKNKAHGTSKTFYWASGDVASEAIALATCIRAAVEITVTG